MKNIALIPFLIIISVSAFAQKMDTQEIQKVEAGQYVFAKGEIQVTFTDTIRREFVEKQFDRLKIEVLKLNVHPITAQGKANLPDSIIAELSKSPLIEGIRYSLREFPEKSFQEMVERQNIPEEEVPAVRKRFEEMFKTTHPVITFKHWVRENEAREFVERNREHIGRLNMIIPKTAVIKTKVGEEAEMRKKMEQLVYVTNTALIAILAE